MGRFCRGRGSPVCPQALLRQTVGDVVDGSRFAGIVGANSILDMI